MLEQYNSYIMQKPEYQDNCAIWIPLVTPISWGWSIRATRVPDQRQFAIARRKLLMPNIANNGLQLPQWERNIHEFSIDLPHHTK